MNPLISVIVPIYKVEKYIERCVDSIINQTYKNLEIILVDDGSPDNCPDICDDYAKKDGRVKVIHKQNGGLSDARNAGICVATGEFISFIDSDDYISLNFYKILLDAILSEKSDIVECSAIKFYDDNHFDEYDEDNIIKTYSSVEAFSKLISENEFHQYVWNKLYKSKLVKEVKFPVGKINEDEFWTYQIFGKAKKITKINKTMYFYFQRNESIMGIDYNLRRLDALEGKANRHYYIEKNYPELLSESKIDLYGSCMFAYQCVLKYMNGSEKKQAAKIINKYRKSFNLSFNEIRSINNSAKKYFYFAKLNFYLCCKMKAVLNIGF